MKKNKTVAYMMAAALLIGGAGLGTKALFVDQGEAKGNDLVITMGNLNVDTKEGPWQMKSGKGTEITNQDAKNNFNNVKPGDSFEKTITVKNEGSLTQNIEVTGGGYKDSSKDIDGLLLSNPLEKLANRKFSLAKGESKDFTISVKVSESGPHMYDETGKAGSFNQKELKGFNLEDTFNQYKFNAIQDRVENSSAIENNSNIEK